MARSVPLSLICVFLLGTLDRLEAAGLKVAPARFILHDVKPGKHYDIYKETGLRLTIYNDDDTTRSWVLSTHRPSERGQWEKGYAEIPDARWCWFERSEITVGAKNKAYANLYLKIPKEEKYYNQRWVVTLGIDGKPGQGGISLAVDIRAQIETESKADLKAKPAGLLGMKPSTIRFEEMAPGSNKKAQVMLYNNDDTAHSYTISSLFEDSKTERKTYLTHSYIPIPDSGWIEREKKIRIEPGGSTVLRVELTIPDGAAHFGKKWEDILLIQPDEGLAGFVRVQVETREKAKTD